MMREKTMAERQAAMLEVLGVMGNEFHTRAQIAAHIGKSRLDPWDVAVLETLALQGQIEQTTLQGARKHIMQSAFRLKQP